MSKTQMPKALTYKEREYRLQQKYKKKEIDLYTRITQKYKKKIEEEFEKKKKRLDRDYERDLHNLKVTQGQMHPNAKIKKKSTKKSDYANACRLAQLRAKLRDTDSEGFGTCICCPGSMHDRDSLDGGHWIAKGQSRVVALDMRNINAQARTCNRTINGGGKHGRHHEQINPINEKRGKGTTDDLLRLKQFGTAPSPSLFIKSHVFEVETLLLRKKIDQTKKDNYLTKIRQLKKRYIEKDLI